MSIVPPPSLMDIMERSALLKSLVEEGVEELPLFMVPKVHRVVVLNGCHQVAGHQGQEQMLSLMKECFWWPSMIEQMKRMLKGCQRCPQFDG